MIIDPLHIAAGSEDAQEAVHPDRGLKVDLLSLSIVGLEKAPDLFLDLPQGPQTLLTGQDEVADGHVGEENQRQWEGGVVEEEGDHDGVGHDPKDDCGEEVGDLDEDLGEPLVVALEEAVLAELDVLQGDVGHDAGDDDGAEGEVGAERGDVRDSQRVAVHVLGHVHLKAILKRASILDDTFHHQPDGGDKLDWSFKAAHDYGEDQGKVLPSLESFCVYPGKKCDYFDTNSYKNFQFVTLNKTNFAPYLAFHPP